ncbi:unnamed protein product [Phytophthora fragariaefolia]|uniref:Unnamed protein product n=1 Tax=Phytophthora fragariaefolia TaxID=1490495 RepID=A0A9W7CPF6_9STRA|nr:unnamed protein product [Phytophthora fragariaefolia]
MDEESGVEATDADTGRLATLGPNLSRSESVGEAFDVLLAESPTWRRQLQKMRKARAKEQRELRAALEKLKGAIGSTSRTKVRVQNAVRSADCGEHVGGKWGHDRVPTGRRLDVHERSQDRLHFVRIEVVGLRHEKKVEPFGCSNKKLEGERIVQVRLARTAKVTANTYQRVELAVVAREGTTWLFMPAQRVEPHLMLAPTLTAVKYDKLVIPMMNLVGSKAQLPVLGALGTWAPTTEDMEVMELTGDLTRDGVMRWLQKLGDEEKPLSNEEKELLMTLLQHYPTLLEPREGCPPAMTLGVSHEIHTGVEPPIKVRSRRHAQQEHEIIGEHVEEMLKKGVIEESHGYGNSRWVW